MRVGGNDHDAETTLAISIKEGFFLKNVEVHALWGSTGPLKSGAERLRTGKEHVPVWPP